MAARIRVPYDAIALDFVHSGLATGDPALARHSKTVPYTIVAQALHGGYRIQTPASRVTVTRGEAFLAAPGTPLTITEERDAAGRFLARWVHFRFMVFGAVDISTLLDIPPKVDQTYGECFGSIISEVPRFEVEPSGDLRDMVHRTSLGYRLLDLLLEVASLRPEGEGLLGPGARLMPALNHIHGHLGDDLTVGLLAEANAVSPSRLHALFQRHLAMAPMQYVKRCRLNRAAHDLAYSARPVGDIADRVGFKNQFHFSREFKALFGVTPSTYRLRHATQHP